MKLYRLLFVPVAALLMGCTEDNPFEGEDYKDAAPMIHSGDVVLVTNRNVEKFLTEVTYEDKDWSYTRIYDYYGGFNRVKYNENGVPDENGTVVKTPKSDKPERYSIRWLKNAEAGELTLTLEEPTLKQEIHLNAGACYADITNLVPNTNYNYKVTYNTSGEVAAEGSFSTTGHLHQVFFQSGCRNGRDLGGWKTLDGKTVKYHKIYRGGRMQVETVNLYGKEEIISEGIGAQLDLRGTDDVLSKPTVEGFDFCAPVIEQGGVAMLNDVNESGINKTRQCFEFVLQSIKAGKGVYYHCSLGRDRTGTLTVVLLGLLGVPEHDISKEYEVTYFAPLGYSCSSSEKESSYDKEAGGWLFQNNRTKWVYSEIAPYFWQMADKTESKTFAAGVEKYLLEVAGVSKQDIDDFRALMLEDKK